MPLSKIQDIGNQVVPNLGPRNIIINGAMNLAQRATSATGLGGSGGSDGYNTCDRWSTFFNTSGALTMSQDSSAPSGFANSLKILVEKKLNEGLKEKQIYEYLKEKYGEWILYEPEFNKNTYFLWLLPILMFLVGGAIILKLFIIKKS